jgi:hypothetical protein
MVGVSEAVALGGTGVSVLVAVPVGVLVLVAVYVGVCVGVSVLVGMALGMSVAVGIGVDVSDAVGRIASVGMVWGAGAAVHAPTSSSTISRALRNRITQSASGCNKQTLF